MSKMKVIRIVGTANGTRSPHDGRYVVRWNPHTRFGTLALHSTAEVAWARRFTAEEAVREWKTISRVEPRRPDGEPNRPLSGLTCELVEVADV